MLGLIFSLVLNNKIKEGLVMKKMVYGLFLVMVISTGLRATTSAPSSIGSSRRSSVGRCCFGGIALPLAAVGAVLSSIAYFPAQTLEGWRKIVQTLTEMEFEAIVAGVMVEGYVSPDEKRHAVEIVTHGLTTVLNEFAQNKRYTPMDTFEADALLTILRTECPVRIDHSIALLSGCPMAAKHRSQRSFKGKLPAHAKKGGNKIRPDFQGSR
jgi:hypothetical protein